RVVPDRQGPDRGLERPGLGPRAPRPQAVPPEWPTWVVAERGRDEEGRRNGRLPEDGPGVRGEVSIPVVEGHEDSAAWQSARIVERVQNVGERHGIEVTSYEGDLRSEVRGGRRHKARHQIRPSGRLVDAVVGED